MSVKKTIALIGANEEAGKNMAFVLAKGAFQLLLAGDEADLHRLADQLRKSCPSVEVDVVGCAVEASWEADMILVSGGPESLENLNPVATRKPVVCFFEEEPCPQLLQQYKTELPFSKLFFIRTNSQDQQEGRKDNDCLVISGREEEIIEAVKEIAWEMV